MPRLLIATQNPSKLEYFQSAFSGADLELLSLKDFHISAVAPEEGNNELENAISKAVFYARESGMLCFSDDAGLYVPALGNLPGVQARRWAGRFPNDLSDEDWLEFFLNEMKDVTGEDRHCHFKIGRALALPDGRFETLTWERHCRILEQPNMEWHQPGWPMNSLLIEKEIEKPWAKMTIEDRLFLEKDNIVKMLELINKLIQ